MAIIFISKSRVLVHYIYIMCYKMWNQFCVTPISPIRYTVIGLLILLVWIRVFHSIQCITPEISDMVVRCQRSLYTVLAHTNAWHHITHLVK